MGRVAPEDAVFGGWLQRRRRSLRISQRALAASVGCSESIVRKLEACERHPSVRVARGLARVLGVPEGEREAFVRFARSGWADVS